MSNNFHSPLFEIQSYSNRKVNFRDGFKGDYGNTNQITLDSKQCKSPSQRNGVYKQRASSNKKKGILYKNKKKIS